MKFPAATVPAILSCAMHSAAAGTKEQTFWKWFQQHEEEIHSFEKDQEAIFDRLAAALEAVHPDLTFEFGQVEKDGTREFVISAGGIKAAFPSVEALHAAAPRLPKWNIIKFRQRSLPLLGIEVDGVKSAPEEVHYVLLKDTDPDKVGIMLFMENYDEAAPSEELLHIGYLFLDQALGEYDVEMHVGAVVFQNRTSKYFADARPLKELPGHFDRRTGRPAKTKPAPGKPPGPPARTK